MAFFESIPLPEPPEPEGPRPEWLEPPESEIPVSLGIDVALAVGDKAAIYISRPVVYSTGLVFDVVTIRRATNVDSMMTREYGHFRPPPAGQDVPAEFLRFGVELSDGRRFSNIGSFPVGAAGPEGEPAAVLLQRGGSGGGSRYQQEWWLWPIPAAGDVTLVCEWPAFGIPESRATLSGDAVRRAAAQARAIWPLPSHL